MAQNTERTFDPSIGDMFHALVKTGGKLKMHNGHLAGPRPGIHHTVMPLRGQWKLPEELRSALEGSRSIEQD